VHHLQATKPGGLLVAEGAKYMLQLKAEQADAFAAKVSSDGQAGLLCGPRADAFTYTPLSIPHVYLHIYHSAYHTYTTS
jgi:hypothetical protein